MIMRTGVGVGVGGVWVLSTGDEKGLGNVIFKILKGCKGELAAGWKLEGEAPGSSAEQVVLSTHQPRAGGPEESSPEVVQAQLEGICPFPGPVAFGERAGWERDCYSKSHLFPGRGIGDGREGLGEGSP